ncbi:MAG TPA: hypothetical protein VGM39_26495 [Kofleriaceae bacterium]|jgi:hypothetical protein
MSKRSVLILLALSACKQPPTSQQAQEMAESKPKATLPSDVLEAAAARIETRQKAVKAWRAVDATGTEPCAQAPAAPALNVNGFRTGTSDAEKTMTILSAAEIDGALDPSYSADLAKDMLELQMSAAALGSKKPNNWTEIDHTTEALPFQAGPIAKTLQYEIRKLEMGESTMDAAKISSLLSGAELVVVVGEQTRPYVDTAAHSFTPGAMRGTALLYSYDTNAVICAGTFVAQNERDSFEADRAQAEGLPEEELKLNAYRAAIANLHKTP